ncbi:Uncharacterised protein [Enterococcus gallinarum]|uniref:Uncharacterized protein n=1 Tax=Enterococcus gallinarum TaxID=1353 RepID=A0A376H3B8_ENTGA|nr:Uncharacterised protein [Enterococcus gallinarum]STD83664.1 Uncharacterised protein [Enterococcus gallinarum]
MMDSFESALDQYLTTPGWGQPTEGEESENDE